LDDAAEAAGYDGAKPAFADCSTGFANGAAANGGTSISLRL